MGLVANDAHGRTPPSLPFYQPTVNSTQINTVVTNTLPYQNAYTISDAWDGTGYPIIPISNWRMSQYTGYPSDLVGFPTTGATSGFQRGQVDAFAESGVWAWGSGTGMWLNSMNALEVAYNGSAAMGVGCWYNSSPWAQMFPNPASSVDVSFEVGVGYEGTMGNANDSVYFQFIIVDRSGDCDWPNYGSSCKRFSLQVNFYSNEGGSNYSWYSTGNDVISDQTGTGGIPLAWAGVNNQAWITPMPDSMAFQISAFSPRRVHFRISPSQLIAIRNAVASFDPTNYSGLSTDPSKYALSLMVVNAETYDPCKDPTHIRPCIGGDHAQIGLSVKDIQVRSTIPHSGAGAPYGFDGVGPLVLQNAGSQANAFANATGSGLFALQTVPALSAAVGVASGLTDVIATRTYFRDSNGHIESSAWASNQWNTPWDMTTGVVGATTSASDPRPFKDPGGYAHVVYRSSDGNVHDVYRDSAGWHHWNVSQIASPVPPAAVGTPTGYVAGSADRIVFRDVNNHIREMYYWGGVWNQWDMFAIWNGANAYSDPRPYVDGSGWPHVAYRDISGHVHEFYMDSGGWHHWDVTSLAGGTAALGNPNGVYASGKSRIVFVGTDSHIHELSLNAGTWTDRDLTAQIRGGLTSGDDPMIWLPADGVARIDYRGSDGQLHEFFYSQPQPGVGDWLHRDM